MTVSDALSRKYVRIANGLVKFVVGILTCNVKEKSK